jgi:hypothetical protein
MIGRAAASLALIALLGFMAVGQNQRPANPNEKAPVSAPPTRDNFGPHAGKLPRLSREALEKATKEEVEDEEAHEKRPERTARAPASPTGVPLHRLSRDVMLHPLTAASHSGAHEWQITLKKSFIENYKNRATLSTRYRVISYKKHAPAADGDAHVAGLTEDVGFACVAEIMNVKSFLGALAAVRSKASSGELVPVTGAWRLWCEHPDAEPATAGPRIQDDVIPDFTTSNPNHIFEIHPLSRFVDIPLEESFAPIDGFTPKEASKAFQVYESLPCRIVSDEAHQTTTLFTSKVEYNYVEFILQLEEDQQFVTLDGRIVRCSVFTLGGKEVAQHRRMVFVQNTPPEKAVRSRHKGDKMHVLGIPRIDLAVISWRTRMASTRPEVLEWNLPYEMIVVGLYED